MIGRVRSRWTRVILVCGKCERKLKGGFGADRDRRLSKLLRKRAGGKGRKAAFGVISTGCLKLCPKGAVTVVDGARPSEWLVVTKGTPIDELSAALTLDSNSVLHAERVSASTSSVAT